MWQILHKCFESDPEPVPYAIYRAHEGTQDLTKVKCSKFNGCGEEFTVLGKEMFQEAHQAGSRLPEGFVIARSRTPG